MSESPEVYAVDELDVLNQEAGWRTEYRQLSPGPFHAQFFFGKVSIFDLTKEYLTGSLEVVAADQDDAVSLLIRRPSPGHLRLNGIAMDCGDPFLLAPGCEVEAHTQSNIIVDTYRIPLSRIAEVAEALDLEWQGLVSGGSRKLRLPHEVVDGFTQALDATLFGRSAERVSSGATLTQAVDFFVRSMLSPIDAQTPHKQRPRLGDFRKFQRALEFIEANLSEPITVGEVCRHADVGIRTLERHFLRETAVLPLAYIKARRLNEVRRSLLAANPAETRITQVASQHGIRHLGRFSIEYRRFFSELPSDTLMRAR